jgi:hypothetical protein
MNTLHNEAILYRLAALNIFEAAWRNKILAHENLISAFAAHIAADSERDTIDLARGKTAIAQCDKLLAAAYAASTAAWKVCRLSSNGPEAWGNDSDY